MNVELATCWLLLALCGNAGLAQTPANLGNEHAIVKKPLPPVLYKDGTRVEQSPAPVDNSPVYTYVEQMPTLNGQNAYTASIAAVTQYLVVPPAAPKGQVSVKFEVDKEGYVRHAHIIKGLRADLDSAVVTATRQLPRFTPGKQNGRVARVSFTLPITIPVKKQP